MLWTVVNERDSSSYFDRLKRVFNLSSEERASNEPYRHHFKIELPSTKSIYFQIFQLFHFCTNLFGSVRQDDRT